MAGGSTYTWSHALRIDSKKSPFESPLPQTHQAFADVKPVSWQRLDVGGILTTIYGMDELPQHPESITAFWLLHGRGDTQDSMAYTAAAFLEAWHKKREQIGSRKGLICICFDQRNHGSRMIENDHNLSWKQGNPQHAQHMFATYSGTAHDLSLLITHIESQLVFKIHDHVVGGVSLGGHASWVALMKEPRITAGMIVVGCPDYVRLMTDRAIRAKLRSCMTTDPPGQEFLGSPDFPQSLVAAVERFDPAGILLGELDVYSAEDIKHEPSREEVKRLRPIVEQTLAGKKIICLSGGKDRLVPYVQGEPFLTWLKRGIAKDGWAGDQGIELEDIKDPDAGHQFSTLMRNEAERWICEVLSDDDRPQPRESKM
ncbi:hypothetical protein AC578_6913 [Pseudocercospora eumusae]|uniref:AB hydrolase-1 domain-containing protein n=1 Tax=Pseudocercospora eumusae TaxID=321146 RepID=A0A139H2D9_9PEZI|nr:hypothetical protein AC578_6913 [Pseudocercospora eumusae]